MKPTTLAIALAVVAPTCASPIKQLPPTNATQLIATTFRQANTTRAASNHTQTLQRRGGGPDGVYDYYYDVTVCNGQCTIGGCAANDVTRFTGLGLPSYINTPGTECTIIWQWTNLPIASCSGRDGSGTCKDLHETGDDEEGDPLCAPVFTKKKNKSPTLRENPRQLACYTRGTNSLLIANGAVFCNPEDEEKYKKMEDELGDLM